MYSPLHGQFDYCFIDCSRHASADNDRRRRSRRQTTTIPSASLVYDRLAARETRETRHCKRPQAPQMTIRGILFFYNNVCRFRASAKQFLFTFVLYHHEYIHWTTPMVFYNVCRPWSVFQQKSNWRRLHFMAFLVAILNNTFSGRVLKFTHLPIHTFVDYFLYLAFFNKHTPSFLPIAVIKILVQI